MQFNVSSSFFFTIFSQWTCPITQFSFLKDTFDWENEMVSLNGKREKSFLPPSFIYLYLNVIRLKKSLQESCRGVLNLKPNWDVILNWKMFQRKLEI